MRFETIILLIIAFNVVTAILQRRAKKKAREAQEAASRAVRTSPQPSAASPRGAQSDDPADDEAFDEELRMPSLGRDILDQIARDLGLKVPKSEPQTAERTVRGTPEPTPAPKPVRPSAGEADRRAFEKRYDPEIRRPERPYAIPGVELPAAPAAAVVATTKEPVRSKVRGEAPARKTPGSTPVPRVNLKDPARLREAFIMQEILGAPVSRRERGTVAR